MPFDSKATPACYIPTAPVEKGGIQKKEEEKGVGGGEGSKGRTQVCRRTLTGRKHGS